MFSSLCPDWFAQILWVKEEDKEKKFLAECGHMTPLKGKLSVFGEEIEVELLPDEKGKIPFCHECYSPKVGSPSPELQALMDGVGGKEMFSKRAPTPAPV